MTSLKADGRIWIWVISAIAIVFGLLTIREGGVVVFGDLAARQAAGKYVPFVVWFNFLAGFAYVLTGVGLSLRQRCAVRLAIMIAAATLVMSVAFGIHVATGGEYEHRTAIAMSLRSALWIAVALVAYRLLWSSQPKSVP